MRKKTKRILAMALSVVMLLGVMPTQAFAANTADTAGLLAPQQISDSGAASDEEEEETVIISPPADPEEERRLFFVGMTRARDELILTYVREPSPFLEDIPEQFVLKEKAGKKREEGRMEQMSLFDFIKE